MNDFLESERLLAELRAGGERPRLLLHSCCAPCSTRALTYLADVFDLTVFYYNPNIFPKAEFERRLSEQRRLLSELPLPRAAHLIAPPYDHGEFLTVAQGLEAEQEGGTRCARCFRLRLKRAAAEARARGCDWFATTLTVGPRKPAGVINPIGRAVGEETGVRFLPTDLKKRDGYLLSLRLSEQYGLYRQTYCGCEFAK